MEVVDARVRHVLVEARSAIRHDAASLVFYAAVTSALIWFALDTRLDWYAPVWWVASGAALNVALAAAGQVVEGWRELRRLRRNPAYAAAVADADEADQRAQRIARDPGQGGRSS